MKFSVKLKKDCFEKIVIVVTLDDIDLLYVAPHQRRSLDINLVDYLTWQGARCRNLLQKTKEKIT